MIDVRPARPGDISGVLQLQAEYFVGNLDSEAQKGGFISAQFTARQFDEIAASVALVVAVDRGRVAGYVCAASTDYYRQFPLLAALRQHASTMTLGGRRLNACRSFIYGPVCIARAHRGRGLLSSLYEELLRRVPSSYDVGIALIAKENRPSFEAHVRKLGMTAIGEYEFEGRHYDIVGFSISGHSRPVVS